MSVLRADISGLNMICSNLEIGTLSCQDQLILITALSIISYKHNLAFYKAKYNHIFKKFG